MRLTLLSLAFLLTACGGKNVQPDPPSAANVVEVKVPTYVPIPGRLTERCKWPKTGKPSQAVEVARKRKTCLEFYERNDDATEAIQGKPVP